MENVLAYAGMAQLFLAGLTSMALDLGWRLSVDCPVVPAKVPVLPIVTGVLCIFPKTYGKVTAGGVVREAVKRGIGKVTGALPALRGKEPDA